MCYHVLKTVPDTISVKGERIVNMSGTARLILGLRAAGWDDKRINDFILWIETGEEQYRPKEEK